MPVAEANSNNSRYIPLDFSEHVGIGRSIVAYIHPVSMLRIVIIMVK